MILIPFTCKIIERSKRINLMHYSGFLGAWQWINPSILYQHFLDGYGTGTFQWPEKQIQIPNYDWDWYVFESTRHNINNHHSIEITFAASIFSLSVTNQVLLGLEKISSLYAIIFSACNKHSKSAWTHFRAFPS
jgi:hypothetical protein